MNILINEHEQGKILVIEGNLDTNTAPDAETKLMELLETGDSKLFLNLEITRHRMTEKNAIHNGILENYPISREVFNKTYKISLEN